LRCSIILYILKWVATSTNRFGVLFRDKDIPFWANLEYVTTIEIFTSFAEKPKEVPSIDESRMQGCFFYDWNVLCTLFLTDISESFVPKLVDFMKDILHLIEILFIQTSTKIEITDGNFLRKVPRRTLICVVVSQLQGSALHHAAKTL